MRIKFKKGKQREFLDKIIENLESPSLRGLLQRGISVKYSALKNYYTEYRTMPLNLFEDLCFLAKIDKNSLKFEELSENWGQVKGGKNKFKKR